MHAERWSRILEKRRLRILFVPFEKKTTEVETSERVPQMIKVLSKHYDLVGLKPIRSLRLTHRGKKPFWLFEWMMEKLCFALKGIKLGIKDHVSLLFCSEPEYALVGLIISRILRKPLIVDSHGNKSLQCKRIHTSFYYTAYITFLDLILSKMSTILLVVSEFDKALYVNQGVPSEKIHVLPSFVDLDRVDRAKEGSSRYLKLFNGKKILLFFGNFGYQPNVEALQFINNELAPTLETMPEVEICICGSLPISVRSIDLLVEGRLHRKVKYLGFVPNIYEILHAIDVFICPLWKGVGIIVKILDAMAVDKPIVATRFIQEGIPELNEHNAFLANTRSQFILSVQHLTKHYDNHANLNLREIILSKYSLEVIEKQLCSMMRSVVHETHFYDFKQEATWISRAIDRSHTCRLKNSD